MKLQYKKLSGYFQNRISFFRPRNKSFRPILTRAPSTTAMNAFHYFTFLEFALGHPADAHCAEVCVSCLDAAKTTEVFVTLEKFRFRFKNKQAEYNKTSFLE